MKGMISSTLKSVIMLSIVSMLVVPMLAQNVVWAQELSYSAKCVCGDKNGDSAYILQGKYRTSINIHNPHDVTVSFIKKAVIAKPQREERGQISKWVEEVLRPDEALFVDCKDIKSLPFDQKVPVFFEGFVVLRAPTQTPLDVVGVYTATPKEGQQGQSIDVEEIHPKTIGQGEKPDLTVKIVSFEGLGCPGGQGTCEFEVKFEITNASSVDVTVPFDVKASTDNALTNTITEAGIGAGETIGRTVVLGPGNNCFDPDCEVTVFVDSGGAVDESNESNNTDTMFILG